MSSHESHLTAADELPAGSLPTENGDRQQSKLTIIRPGEPQRLNPMESHDLRGILPDDFKGRTSIIRVPEYGFRPDNWSKALLRGLQKMDVAGKTILEPGVGTGPNIAYLANRPKSARPKEIWGGDYDRRMAPVAAENCDRMLSKDERAIIQLCEGELSLIAWAHRHNVRPDIVYGCLPQVPCPENIHLGDGDSYSHYYKTDDNGASGQTDRHEADINDFGLKLQVLLLREAKDLLAPKGQVVLNLGGRPGRDMLVKMFEKEGFLPEIIHSEIIRQHEGTDLHQLVKREHTMKDVTGHEYEFFRDAKGEQPINATEALRLREADEHVYHYIYVMKATRA